MCQGSKNNCSLIDATFVSKCIHYKAGGHHSRIRNTGSENYQWNNQQFNLRKPIRGVLCRSNTFLLLKRNENYIARRWYGGCTHIPMPAFLSSIAVNNTVLVMIVDYGYIDMWRNSYINGNLSQYKNLAVFCGDKKTYDVISLTTVQS